jgi:aryl-alcohol dehydrogenase-like predicted oxidoreductase
MESRRQPIPLIPFGASKRRVTRVGLGGEGVLRTVGREEMADRVIGQALAEGIAYFDSARVYQDSERYLGRRWMADPAARAGIFQASKSAERTRDGANRQLEETLARLGTDHLDLWQIHDLRTADELRRIEGPGGALEAFVEARDQGLVKHIGVTGHHDPAVLTRAVRQWPVDSVMLPVNPVEGLIGGFLSETLPAARQRGIAVIGMKILGASHYILLRFGVTAERLIRYALARDITVAIVGCGTPEEVETLAAVGRDPTPMGADEAARIEAAFVPYAHKLAFYRGVIG